MHHCGQLGSAEQDRNRERRSAEDRLQKSDGIVLNKVFHLTVFVVEIKLLSVYRAEHFETGYTAPWDPEQAPLDLKASEIVFCAGHTVLT